MLPCPKVYNNYCFRFNEFDFNLKSCLCLIDLNIVQDIANDLNRFVRRKSEGNLNIEKQRSRRLVYIGAILEPMGGYHNLNNLKIV